MKEISVLQIILTKKFGIRERTAIARWKKINEVGGGCFLVCLEGSLTDKFTRDLFPEKRLCSPGYPGYFNTKFKKNFNRFIEENRINIVHLYQINLFIASFSSLLKI